MERVGLGFVRIQHGTKPLHPASSARRRSSSALSSTSSRFRRSSSARFCSSGSADSRYAKSDSRLEVMCYGTETKIIFGKVSATVKGGRETTLSTSRHRQNSRT
jgi:hypothetical protein